MRAAYAATRLALTLDGVRTVVDSGLARRPRFDRGSGLTRLVTERVSQAAAAQRAQTVVEYKSASYTVVRPAQLGVALSTTKEPLTGLLAAMQQFGSPLGRAFQYRDDLLGVFGDEQVTGKPAGDDLREGKRTVLVAHALQSADAEDARRLDAALTIDDLRTIAKRRTPKAAFDYTDGAAEREISMRRSVEALALFWSSAVALAGLPMSRSTSAGRTNA